MRLALEQQARKDAKAPGSRWRVLAHDRRGAPIALSSVEHPSVFDEVCVDGWLHLEQMAKRQWRMQLGDAYISIFTKSDGTVEVNIRRGEYGPQLGWNE